MSGRHTILMCAKTQSRLADRLLTLLPKLVPARMQWKQFESQNPDIIIQNPREIRGADVVFLADATAPGHLLEQWGVLNSLQSLGARSLTIYMCYFPGTIDRKDFPGRLVWAKIVAELFSNIGPCHGTGPARIIIYDIHALQEESFFSSTVVTDIRTDALPYLFEEIRLRRPVTAICFPDDGAEKRFGRLFPHHPTIVCEKRRINDERREIKIKEGWPHGHQILIVDDLTMTCGTILQTAEVLRRAGAMDVCAAIPHLVVPEIARERVIAGGPLSHLYVSDSIPNDIPPHKEELIEVISLDRLILKDMKMMVGI